MDRALTDIVQNSIDAFKEELKTIDTDDELNHSIVKWVIEGNNFFTKKLY